jgi:hypothetical protein
LMRCCFICFDDEYDMLACEFMHLYVTYVCDSYYHVLTLSRPLMNDDVCLSILSHRDGHQCLFAVS